MRLVTMIQPGGHIHPSRPPPAEPRFGLSLSLSEALDLDASDLGRQLAALLRDEGSLASAERLRPTLVIASVVLLGALIYPRQAHAASLRGMWTLSPAASWFDQPVLGAPPDDATLTVSRDDAYALVYRLVETRAAVEIARGEYRASWTTGRVTAEVNGAGAPIASASRGANGGATLTTTPIRGWRASISIHSVGRDRLQVDHYVLSRGRSYQLEQLTFCRKPPSSQTPADRQSLKTPAS